MGASAPIPWTDGSIQDQSLYEQYYENFPMLGVKIYYINEFYDAIGGKVMLKDLTTAEVCDKFIKPMTAKCPVNSSSFCEKLRSQAHPAVAKAEVYVSHAWKYKFLDVIEALQHHFKDTPKKTLWFDIFSRNQHETNMLDENWWENPLKESIKHLGHTVMVVTPFSNTEPFRRSWCIYEAYCSGLGDGKFEIAMSEKKRSDFLKDMGNNPERCMDLMLSLIKAQDCICDKKEDQLVFNSIRETLGFRKINHMVFSQLRRWIFALTKDEISKVDGDGNKSMELKNILAYLHEGAGEYETASPLLSEIYNERLAMLGEEHPDTLQSYYNFGVLLNKQGKYEEARAILEDCLEKRKNVFGNAHDDTKQTMGTLAVVYENMGASNLALALFE